jgi:hypothetical protein
MADPAESRERPPLRPVPTEAPETRALAPVYAAIREIAERLRREQSGDERE